MLRSEAFWSALERDSPVYEASLEADDRKAGEPEVSSQLCTVLKDFPFLLPLLLMPGIELDEDGSLDGSNDLTIRGRLLSLVEKVTYLKKKQAEKPVSSDSRKSCKHL